MTYNHAAHIRQALDSVLMQRTSFDFEIVVTEDCSNDGTREIVLEYGRQFPDRIRLSLSDRNRNDFSAISRGIRACRGDFIATLDGDDYWTDPEKLRIQVEFMEKHPECAACFHGALAVYGESGRTPHEWTPSDLKPFLDLRDIWRGNPITMCSLLFRNGMYELPPWYDTMPIMDWPLHVLNAEHGTIGFIPRTMCAYRIHEGGTYSSLAERAKMEKRFDFYVRMNRHMDRRCDALARNGLFTYFLESAEDALSRGNPRLARFCAWKCLSGRPLRRSRYRRLLRVWWDLARSALQRSPAGERAISR